jgi:hypothetical protein
MRPRANLDIETSGLISSEGPMQHHNALLLYEIPQRNVQNISTFVNQMIFFRDSPLLSQSPRKLFRLIK